MLKAQLRSKIAALGSTWQDVEDILTGDFFGVLDYLPRQPFLHSFVEWIAKFNEGVRQPTYDDVDWESIEFVLWPKIAGEDESTEPDVVILSNQWVIVIEVKLDSGLGRDQPWREYSVGREMAVARGLPVDAVYYLLVTRQRLNVSETLTATLEARDELLAKTLHLLWHQAAALVERWLTQGAGGRSLSREQVRLLTDLRDVLRRRRSIAFSGFSFINQEAVAAPGRRLFCPDRFHGFMCGSVSSCVADAAASRFLQRFPGFLVDCVHTDSISGQLIGADAFRGFVAVGREVLAPAGPLLPVSKFSGFLERCPACTTTKAFEIAS